MKRHGRFSRLAAGALALVFFAQGVAAQAVPQGQPGGEALTAEEEREAREFAAAFAERLVEGRDFAPIVGELYTGDFMRRHVAEAARRGGEFMIDGIPSFTFDASLARQPESPLWPRLYVAANTLMFHTFLAIISRHDLMSMTDVTNEDVLAAFPPAALQVLKRTPATANFVLREGGAEIKTLQELGAAVEAVEEAARLTRAHWAATQSASNNPRLDANLKLIRAAARATEVSLVPEREAAMGYPKGTRMRRALTPVGYDLLLVKEGGRMRVAWGNFVHD
jgi:hypothetical protein